jgi:ribosomal protein S18 acetylase RimI-like enzyme
VNETSAFVCERVGEASAAALAELFERAGSGCFCRYFHFEGDKNAWLARLAFEPAENRRELLAHASRPALTGVVAKLADGTVVGWMKLERALELPKLYAQRTYRSLPVLAEGRERIFTVGCFLVDPAWRRRGVARALLTSGIELARAEGARAIEAFPRRAEAVGDEQIWTGPLGLYRALGFEIVHEQAQYPVLRRELETPATATAT